MLSVLEGPNKCDTTRYCRPRGYTLRIANLDAPMRTIMSHIQRANVGMGVTLARIVFPQGPCPLPARADAWMAEVAAGLRDSAEHMNFGSSGLSLCVRHRIERGEYVADWYLVAIDNDYAAECDYDAFCTANLDEPIGTFIRSPSSPIYTINDRAAESRMQMIRGALVLLDENADLADVVHTPFYSFRPVLGDAGLECEFLSHVSGPADDIVVCLSPAQGFAVLHFNAASCAHGFPVTLPRRGPHALHTQTRLPAECRIHGITEDGAKRGASLDLYPDGQEFVDQSAKSVLCTVERMYLRPVHAIVSGRRRDKDWRYGILNVL